MTNPSIKPAIPANEKELKNEAGNPKPGEKKDEAASEKAGKSHA